MASSSGNVGSDLERACATFTQDNHVAVVLSTTGFFDEAFTQCLARARVPLVSSDYALGDDQALRAASTLIAASTLTTDARTSQLLQRFSETKRLTRTSRLGVVVEGCAYTRRTYDRTVVPLAKRLGMTVAGHEETRCFHGLPDLGGQAAELQSVVLRFQSSRVSDVLFVSGGMEGNLMLLFGAAAESQRYHPHYALTSGVSAVVQEGNTPATQLQNAAGLGWLPDVDSDRTKVTRPAQVQCLADLRRSGLSPTSPVDRTYGYTACDSFSLLTALLRLTSGSTEAWPGHWAHLAGASPLPPRTAGRPTSPQAGVPGPHQPGLRLAEPLRLLRLHGSDLHPHPLGARVVPHQQHLQERLTELARKHGVVGASLAVQLGESQSVAATGVLNLRTQQPATPESVFQFGSITKVWTATLVMQLVDEGLLDLDEPVARYLRDFKVASPSLTAAVTARHLLATPAASTATTSPTSGAATTAWRGTSRAWPGSSRCTRSARR